MKEGKSSTTKQKKGGHTLKREKIRESKEEGAKSFFHHWTLPSPYNNG